MEFIGTAILIVGMLFVSFIAFCVLLIVVGMCLPLFGIRTFRRARLRRDRRWLRR